MSKVIDLYEFLLEAELHQYYSDLKNDLKASLTILLAYFIVMLCNTPVLIFLHCLFQVMTVPQVKFVTEDDLYQIGMTKPEIRRLKKYFQKYYPQNYFSKFKKVSVH